MVYCGYMVTGFKLIYCMLKIITGYKNKPALIGLYNIYNYRQYTINGYSYK